MSETEQLEFPIEKFISSNTELYPKVDITRNDNEIFRKSLPKGKYDINYVINLLRIIHDKIESMKFNARDIPFTMCDSMRRLIANLETERDQQR